MSFDADVSDFVSEYGEDTDVDDDIMVQNTEYLERMVAMKKYRTGPQISYKLYGIHTLYAIIGHRIL